jgi:hypothetical protein
MFNCTCTAHFNGTTCTDDVNECATDNGGCDPHRVCINGYGNRTCGVACDAGWYGEIDGSAACTACSPGHFGNVTGLAVCFACDIGSFQHAAGETSCLPCQLHTFVNETGAVHCINCTDGTYQPETGKTGCVPCPDGLFGPECTLTVDVCASSPCRNGATCLAQRGNYTCVCAAEFDGPACNTTIVTRPVTIRDAITSDLRGTAPITLFIASAMAVAVVTVTIASTVPLLAPAFIALLL